MAAASTNILIFSLHTLLSLLHRSQCKTLYKIQQNLPLHDGDVLLSDDGNFALGFFSPRNSTRRYIGTWYNRLTERTIFWVANRDKPINDTSGVLSINSHGDLVLYCRSNGSTPLWSTNVWRTFSENATTAQLQDTGNFVLLPRLSNHVLWQSFDHPTDTMKFYMKLGLDKKTGMDRFLTSWQSMDDPGLGSFTYRIDPTGYPQLFLYKNGAPHWRAGPWTGLRWSGVTQMTNNYIFNMSFVNDRNELSIFYGITNRSIVSRLVIEPSGLIQLSTWQERDQQWMQIFVAPLEQCDYYGACGPNSNCNPYNISQFPCSCLPGFVPRSPAADWFVRDGYGGCVRSPGVSTCRSGEGFVKVARVKVPDTSRAHVDMSLSLKECELQCLNNCSCTAYTIADESRLVYIYALMQLP